LERRKAVDRSVDPNYDKLAKDFLVQGSQNLMSMHRQVKENKVTCHFVNNKTNHAFYIL